MRATGFTHVSISARNLEESSRFYKDLLGMEEAPSPDFPFPVRWLRVGDLQLHLFQSDDPAPATHHFGVEVDDFETVYSKVNELSFGIGEGYFSKVYELPDGAVQLYVRDPAGNMVEINWPDAATLDRAVVPEIHKIPGSPDARLYLRR